MQEYASRNNMTRAWKCYEEGRRYNQRLVPDQYSLVNTNIEFYAGNQWLHLPETAAMRRLGRPSFNIIKRIASLFVASLTSSAATIRYAPLSYYDSENLADPDSNAAAYATAEVRNLMEKFHMDYRLRQALTDGAVTGDYCAHFYWDADALPYGGAFGSHRGEICMELVDGINVMFGNPNSADVQSQPYILLVGRDTVEHLNWEAERYRKRSGKKKAEGAEIRADADYEDQAGLGGKVEIASDDASGKCLYVYMYTKQREEQPVLDAQGRPVMETVCDSKGNPVPLRDEQGKELFDDMGLPLYQQRAATQVVTKVKVTKATRECNIYEDVDTGLTLYPIAWGNWEKQKNQYHGRALVTGIVPNQIYINTTFALIMRHLQLLGFPKTVYNADYIREWTNEVGMAIGVRGLAPGQRLADMAYNLQPADMSGQILMTIDKAIAYTKECLGATDAQMGNVRPDNTSALMVLQSSAAVPLENIRAGLYEWLEDIGTILLDMMGTYYGQRPIVRERRFVEPVMDGDSHVPLLDPVSGKMRTQEVSRRVVEPYDFTQLKHLWLNVGVDVGATTYYSEIAMTQTLDNLRHDGILDAIQYLERVPDKLIPRKEELLQELKDAAAKVTEQMAGAETVQPAKAIGVRTGPAMGGGLSEEKYLSQLSAGWQERFEDLPEVAKRALLESVRNQ